MFSLNRNCFVGKKIIENVLHRAVLYSHKNKTVRCYLCWNTCRIEEGERGFCNTRINRNGELFTLTYGNISAMESRPIEIKPFYHFKPSSTSMTFSTYSCNLHCPWCQNWHLSRKPPPGKYLKVEPEFIVEEALRCKDSSICASFNEPTLLFEFLLDLFPAAKKKGLLCTMVSNGYMTPKALKKLVKAGLDAINIDIKGNPELCGIRNKKVVWRNVKYALKLCLHVEVINLIVTEINDSDESLDDVIGNHLKYAGEKIPLHFTRYFPAFLFDKAPTKVEILEKAVEKARKNGIEFPYIGNVPNHKYGNTYCPECGKLLVERNRQIKSKIKEGKCWNCGKRIYGIW